MQCVISVRQRSKLDADSHSNSVKLIWFLVLTKLGYNCRPAATVRRPMNLEASLGGIFAGCGLVARACSEELAIIRVGLILPPGFAVLSFAPLQVFETANSILDK